MNLVPLGIWLAVRPILPEVLAEPRVEAARVIGRRRRRAGAIASIVTWILAGAALAWGLAGLGGF